MRVKTLIAKAEASPVHTIYEFGGDGYIIRVYEDETCKGEYSSLVLRGSQAMFYGTKVSLKQAAKFIGLD